MADKTMFVTSLIDLDLWNKAGWKGTGFLYRPDLSLAPGLALIFHDSAVGRKIFEGWRARLGMADKYEEMRVAIIEGDLPGEDPGYTVHLSSNVAGVLARARAEGQALAPDLVTVVSRIHRMNPDPGSPHLDYFKRSFAKHGYYGLLPMVMGSGGAGDLTPLGDLAITKREISFRQVGDIAQDDVDHVAISRDQTSRE